MRKVKQNLRHLSNNINQFVARDDLHGARNSARPIIEQADKQIVLLGDSLQKAMGEANSLISKAESDLKEVQSTPNLPDAKEVKEGLDQAKARLVPAVNGKEKLEKLYTTINTRMPYARDQYRILAEAPKTDGSNADKVEAGRKAGLEAERAANEVSKAISDINISNEVEQIRKIIGFFNEALTTAKEAIKKAKDQPAADQAAKKEKEAKAMPVEGAANQANELERLRKQLEDTTKMMQQMQEQLAALSASTVKLPQQQNQSTAANVKAAAANDNAALSTDAKVANK